MADLSKIVLPSGTTYNIKDEVARQTAGGGLKFRGITQTAIEDESSVASYSINGDEITAENGDLVIYNRKEFLFSSVDNQWHELGDNSAFHDLAYADTASAEYTPAGNITTPEFTGTQGNLSVTGVPEGTVAIGTGDGSPNYTPEGSISKPNVSVQLDTTTKYVAESATAGGVATPGTAAQCTMPELEFTVNGETLNIAWTEGSFTANTPTQVTMPSFVSQTVASGVQSAALDANPVFSGTPVSLEAQFNGDSLTATGTFTPEGTLTRPTFTGTPATITVQ